MGMRPEEVMDAELQPVNLASGAQWAFPPTLLMAARNDQDEIIDLINRTETHLESQVWRSFATPLAAEPSVGKLPHTCTGEL